MTRRWFGLAGLSAAWLFTVLIRFHFHAEPGEMLWFLWVGAQGICAASLGYLWARPRR